MLLTLPVNLLSCIANAHEIIRRVLLARTDRYLHWYQHFQELTQMYRKSI